MKRKFIIVIILIFTGCYITDPIDNEEYLEDSYFFKTTMGDYEIYRSSRYVAVKFVEGITPGKAEKLTKGYYLTPVTMMYHENDLKNWDELLEERIIIMRLPGEGRLENYLSNYPRNNVHCFGDLPEVQFCLPTFSLDKKGGPESRILFDMHLFNWATSNKWVYIQPGGYDVY
jgi:hypothetical protein